MAERDAVRLDQRPLHARPGAEPAHRPAATLQFARDREARHHVPAGAGGDDHQVLRAPSAQRSRTFDSPSPGPLPREGPWLDGRTAAMRSGLTRGLHA
jgi:hypothetical protein